MFSANFFILCNQKVIFYQPKAEALQYNQDEGPYVLLYSQKHVVGLWFVMDWLKISAILVSHWNGSKMNYFCFCYQHPKRLLTFKQQRHREVQSLIA